MLQTIIIAQMMSIGGEEGRKQDKNGRQHDRGHHVTAVNCC